MSEEVLGRARSTRASRDRARYPWCLRGQRLAVHKGDGASLIRWRRVVLVDIVACFVVPFATAWGIASAVGLEELSDVKVIGMSLEVTVVYWSVLVLLVTHLVFNRTASLSVTASQVVYRIGRMPGRVRVVERTGPLSISMETREDPIAESDASGRTPDRTLLTIHVWGGPRIVIDDLSEDNAILVKDLLEGQA